MSLVERLLGKKGAGVSSPDAKTRPRGHVDVEGVLRSVIALSGERRFTEVHHLVERALADAPDHPDLLFAKGGALLDMGRFAEARSVYESLERAGHSSAPVAVQLAAALHRAGDVVAAEHALNRAVTADPVAYRPRYALGTLLLLQDRIDEALPQLEAAIAADPSSADARVAYGNALMDVKRYGEAEAEYRRATEIAPQSPAAWTNVGYALGRQDRYADAIIAFERAYELEAALGGDVDAFVNYTAALGDDGRDAEAIAVFERCLPSRPAPKAHFNYAVSLLRSGHLAEGWCQQEHRWLFEPFQSLRPDYGVPTWTGQSLEGKTLLVRAEQGLGDTIQMLRYVPALATLGARVLLRAPPGLQRLGYAVEGMAEVLEQGAINPPFDFYVHAMSLPGVFGTTLDTVPADVPYMSVETERRDRWSARLGIRTKPRVGIVWAGSPTHLKDQYRSVRLDALTPLFGIRDVEFVSLQKGPQAEQLAAFEGPGHVLDLGPELDDLADTAAVLEQLDLVVGVDTAVMHLAGALGVPAWIMVPTPCDWRWLTNRADNPWYPTMRVYRQTERNRWDDAIRRVADDLAAWAVDPGAARGEVVRVPQANVARLRAARPAPPRAVAVPGMGAVAETRWGIVQYPEDGSDLAASLALLGEWLEPQVRVAFGLLTPDSVVLEVGAGVGIHALAFATTLKAGRIYAFETRSPQRRLLQQNIESNGHTNVAVAGNDPSRAATSPADSIDAMRLDRLDLLKVNRPEQSMPVVQGSAETLWRARPAMMLAVAPGRDVADLAEHVKQFGYRCWHMRVPMFDPGNFGQRVESPFGEVTITALLAVPEEIELAMTLPHCTLMD